MTNLKHALPVAIGLLLWVTNAGHVVAQEQTAQATQDNASDEVARGLFQAGRASYDAGKYDDALKYFQQAYDLSQRPGLLYNIGQATDRLHQDRKTIEVFRLYLERVPEADNRAEVEGRLRTLERLVQLEAAEATPAETTPESAPQTTDATPAATTTPVTFATDDANGPGIAPWLVIGGGGVLLVTGVALTLVGAGQIADVEDAKRGTAWSSVSSSADSGPTLATAGIVLMSVGFVGAAAGLTWLLGSSSGEHVEVVLGPGSVHLTGAL